MSLIDPKKTIEVIQGRNFNFKKSFGQNFLVDEHVLTKIIDAAQVCPDDLVLEIGPGIGTLTEALCERAGKVIAVEIDNKLIPILRDNLARFDNIEIINNDILRLDVAALVAEHGGKPIKVVANLPYYITTPIIMELLEKRIPMISATLMVQKEVAERMQSGPGSKDYGALSLAVQYFSKPEICANVPPNCFIPRPKVGSAVIRLTTYCEPPVTVSDEAFMFGIIRAAFEQRRKTMVNALSAKAGLGISKDAAAAALHKIGLDPLIRGEALTLMQFAAFADAVKSFADGIH